MTIVAEGSRSTVTFGAASSGLGRIEVDDRVLGVGRFGLYAIDPVPAFTVTFTDVKATTDPPPGATTHSPTARCFC